MLCIFVKIFKMKATRFLLLMLLFVFYSCKSDNDTVFIGTDEWMTENLSVKKFNNGDPIPEAKTDADWLKAGQDKSPAWCYQNNDPANEKSYGILYNYYAVSDERGLLPEGFHLATDEADNDKVDRNYGFINYGMYLRCVKNK